MLFFIMQGSFLILASGREIRIDGWTHPSERKRMCLGFRGYWKTTHEVSFPLNNSF